jgi:hypothetical protein
MFSFQQPLQMSRHLQMNQPCSQVIDKQGNIYLVYPSGYMVLLYNIETQRLLEAKRREEARLLEANRQEEARLLEAKRQEEARLLEAKRQEEARRREEMEDANNLLKYTTNVALFEIGKLASSIASN